MKLFSMNIVGHCASDIPNDNMSFDRFLLVVESRDPFQADSSFIYKTWIFEFTNYSYSKK